MAKPKNDPNPKPGDQERRFAEEPAPGMVGGKLDVVSDEEVAARMAERDEADISDLDDDSEA